MRFSISSNGILRVSFQGLDLDLATTDCSLSQQENGGAPTTCKLGTLFSLQQMKSEQQGQNWGEMGEVSEAFILDAKYKAVRGGGHAEC